MWVWDLTNRCATPRTLVGLRSFSRQTSLYGWSTATTAVRVVHFLQRESRDFSAITLTNVTNNVFTVV